MTGVQVMVVLIVAMVMIASIVKSRHTGRRGRDGVTIDAQEAARLKQEVAQLKERLAVIERITVEKENSLERQIEELRDR